MSLSSRYSLLTALVDDSSETNCRIFYLVYASHCTITLLISFDHKLTGDAAAGVGGRISEADVLR